MTTNFQRTKAWLEACSKEQTADNLSVQVGCIKVIRKGDQE